MFVIVRHTEKKILVEMVSNVQGYFGSLKRAYTIKQKSYLNTASAVTEAEISIFPLIISLSHMSVHSQPFLQAQ